MVLVGLHAAAVAFKVKDEVVAVALLASVAVAVMVYDPPATVGVPLMTPLDAFNVTPAGSEPDSDHV